MAVIALEKTFDKTVTDGSTVFGEEAVSLVCPFCRHNVVTIVSYNAGTLTWFLCGLFIFFGLWLGCCLIPFYIKDVKDCVHSCPNCNQTLGRYNRL